MLPRSLLLPTDISGVRMTSCDRLAPGWVISGSAELKLLSGDGRLLWTFLHQWVNTKPAPCL
jgi:hypothetical protein